MDMWLFPLPVLLLVTWSRVFFIDWEFVWDDTVNFSAEGSVQAFLEESWWNTLFNCFDWHRARILGTYEPVSNLLKCMFAHVGNIYQEVGKEARFWHFLAVSLHLLLHLLVQSTLLRCFKRTQLKRSWCWALSMLVCTQFTNPVNVQTVCWVSCLPYIFCTLFSCQAIIQLQQHSFWGFMVFYLIAVLCKAVALPLPLAAYVMHRERLSNKRGVCATAIFLGLLAFCFAASKPLQGTQIIFSESKLQELSIDRMFLSVLLYFSFWGFSAVHAPIVPVEKPYGNSCIYILCIVCLFQLLIVKIFRPNMARKIRERIRAIFCWCFVCYAALSFPFVGMSVWNLRLGIFLFLGLLSCYVTCIEKESLEARGLLAYFLLLLPVLGFVQHGEPVLWADRYCYFPNISWWLLYTTTKAKELSTSSLSYSREVLAQLAVFLLLMNHVYLTQSGIQVYAGGVSLWSFGVKSNPEYSQHHHQLGVELALRQDFKGAIKSLNEAVLLSPFNGPSYKALGSVFGKLGDSEAAIQSYENALKCFSSLQAQQLAGIYNDLGVLHSQKKRFSLAVQYFEKGLSLSRSRDPKHREWHANYCLALVHAEEYSIAVKEIGTLWKEDADLANALAGALIGSGKVKKAKNLLQKALELFPDNPDIKLNLRALQA